MASLITVRIDKGSSPNLGFRLQGGKDFGTPLVIQKVNGGSPAERAGLIAGDSVIKINNTDVFNLRHKDAQDVVVRAGPSFEVTLQRGGSTWKPSVVPTGSYPSPTSNINNLSPVTKTSLSAKSSENIGVIGTGHNLSAKPFSPQVNGTLNGGPKVVVKQYNSPIKLYSEESIAETLSAQTEVLPTGALGVNFKKNEKNYDASNSAVLRALKEAESDPKSPDEAEPDSGIVTAPNSGVAGLRHVHAPENRPAPANPQLPPGQNICADCERLIVGVFVRIKEKNLHVECFKCSTCGTSLKNVGYYNINNKLYCDIHAKAAAIRANQNPGLVPVAVPPGGKAPAHAISAALSSHSLPSPSPLSPKLNNSFASPYQPQEFKENVDVSPVPVLAKSNEPNNNNLYSNPTPVSFSKYLNKSSTNSSGPKPFSSVSAPLSPHNTLPRTAPLSPVAPAPFPSYNTPSYTTPSFSPASSAGRNPSNITWPPPQEEPELPTACPLFYPPPSHVEQRFQKRSEHETDLESEYTADCSELEEIHNLAQYADKMSFEVLTERKSATECIETISESLETQRLVENILKTRADIPPPLEEDIRTTELPRRQAVQESMVKTHSSSSVISDQSSCRNVQSCELKRPTQFTPNTVECKLQSKIENSVPLKWESPLTQAIRTTGPDADTFASIPTKHSHSALASALVIAPSQPFTPHSTTTTEAVPLPEETVPYFPPERPVVPPREEAPQPKSKPEKPKSQFVKALEVIPEPPRCATPVRPVPPPVKNKPKDPMDKYFEDLPKPQQKISLLAALTTAPDRSYSPFPAETEQETKQEAKPDRREKIDKTLLTKPMKPAVLPQSFAVNKKDPKPPGYYPPQMMYQKTEETKSEEHTEKTNTSKTTVIEKQTIQNPQVTQIVMEEQGQTMPTHFAPIFQGFSCSFQNKTDHSQFSVEVNTTPPILTPPPKIPTPVIKTVETPGYIKTETVTEEKQEHQQTTKKLEQSKEELKTTAKQQEEIVLKKASTPVILHKPEGLPQYQVQLEENAEADLKYLEKKQKMQEKIDQQNISKQHTYEQQMRTEQKQGTIQKPVIKIVAEDTTLQQQRFFKPVIDERPPSRTFSPRPGTITPSMINKPPPILPYYQASLVPQKMTAPEVNLLDPKSPAISRSPSPCLGVRRDRSPSPFRSNEPERAVSPAPGPPPNPLTSHQRLPTPRDSKMDQARENLTTFIPEYKSKRDLIERVQGAEAFRKEEERSSEQQQMLRTQQSAAPAQMYVSTVQTSNYPVQQTTSSYNKQLGQQKMYESKTLEVQESDRVQRYSAQTAGGTVSTSIDEKMRQAHLEQLKQSQSESVQRSADGRTQVQRKKVVTEEFERTQKETNIQIEKNVVKKHPFRDVNPPAVEAPGVAGMHLTNPQPIASPFLRQTVSSEQQARIEHNQQQYQAQQQTQLDCGKSCQKSCASQQDCQQYANQSATASASSSNPNAAFKPVKHVFAPNSLAPVKHVEPPGSSKKSNQSVIKPNVSQTTAGVGGGRQAGGISVAPKRGRGVLNAAALGSARIPLCGSCNMHIRGPFITALGKIWCPNHFVCTTPSCKRPLQDLGFVEERGQLYCEYCFERYLAPDCSKCNSKIKGDCLKAIGKNFHPECFNCVYCGKLFGNNPFFLEDGSPYCDADWNELFTTKCFACGFPVEAGDRWVEALNNNYHSQCFNCTMCKKNLEGQSFFAKGGRPFCKNHAR